MIEPSRHSVSGGSCPAAGVELDESIEDGVRTGVYKNMKLGVVASGAKPSLGASSTPQMLSIPRRTSEVTTAPGCCSRCKAV